MPSEALHIFSDFDNTVVPVNIAGLLVKHYIVNGPGGWLQRARRGAMLLIPTIRREKFSVYYECLQRIPAEERHHIVRAVAVNEDWLRKVTEILGVHRKKSANVTIITRNSIDIVHDWVQHNKGKLRRYNIKFEGIIANGPMDQTGVTVVKEHDRLRHIDYLRLGQMQEEEKTEFLNKNSVYIGDSDDEILQPFVKEFYKV